jgi:hypothetical protein
MILNRHSPKYREMLWLACLDDMGKVICNLCGMPVRCGDDWDESHIGAPAALGGRTVGIAHRRCNQQDGHDNVTPRVAKAKRQKRKHLGIAGPGLSDTPMPGGKRSKLKKTIRGRVVPRQSQSELYKAAMARLYPQT